VATILFAPIVVGLGLAYSNTVVLTVDNNQASAKDSVVLFLCAYWYPVFIADHLIFLFLFE
jgi:hypothetical protein